MPFERGYALLVGVGSYQWIPKANIPVSVRDARQVRDVLCDERFCGYLPEKVTLLHDELASREGILAALQNIAERATQADTVFLYYSGHGEYGTDGLFYMTCGDTKVAGNKVLTGTGISEKELLDALRAIPAGKLIFFFNACHSGEVSPHLGLEEKPETFGSTNLPNATADAILASGAGRVIITACQENQKSWIGKGEISIFARALVDGLKGRARYNAGYIGAFGLYEYLYEATKEAASDLGHEQEPELTVLKGLGPFPVALYRGANEPQSFDNQEELPEEAAVRRISERASRREFQRITNIIIQTEGGAYIGGNVNTGGGDFVGRDQHKVTIAGDLHAPVILGSGNVIHQAPDPQKLAEQEREKARHGYLDELRAACQVLPLAAIGGDDSGDAEITLDQVYIDLDTTSSEEPTKEGKLLIGKRERPVSAMEAVVSLPRTVLLGEPGAGKSTFVRRLVGWLAAAGLGEKQPPEGLDPNLTPIFITLRDLAQRLRIDGLEKLPAAAKQARLLEALHEQIRAELKQLGKSSLRYSDALLETLSSGTCLLVMDGLDEVPFDLRERVRETVASTLSRYHIRRVIITCRVRSYAGAAVFHGFEAYTLAPFDEQKIKQFCKAWYNTQLILRKVAGKEQAEKRAGDLARAALTLKDLAANPMLLTSMAIIHQRDIGLPDQRVRLYSLVVDVLVRRWQKHKVGELADFLQDDLRLRGVLERLGYEAQRTGMVRKEETGDLPRMEALRILEGREYLGDISLANAFLDYVDQRAGLLVGRGGEPGCPSAYGFPHRSLQEYLAGCYLIGQRDLFRQLYDRASEGDGWDLAVQLGMEELVYNRRGTHALLDLAYQISYRCQGLASSQPQASPQERMLLWSGQAAALLGAGTIREDAGSMDGGPRYLEQIRRQLVNILSGALAPVERCEAGKALATLGDSRFNAEAWYLPADEMLGFVEIPGGPFWMGSDPKKDPATQKNEQPQHLVDVSTFYIARYPVTVAQFRSFVQSSGYQVGYEGSLTGVLNHPVMSVSWEEALSYCDWLDKTLRESTGTPPRMQALLQDGYRVKLPTEAEWEKAARVEPADRGNDRRIYPWGDDFDPNKANTNETQLGTTSPVGCFAGGASPYGLLDMSGNVWEWCADRYGEKYYAVSPKQDPKGPKKGVYRVLRGGSWGSYQYFARCAFRDGNDPDYRGFYIGFRCVLSR